MQSRCVYIDDSGKLLVLDWESWGLETVTMTNWQVLQFSGNGSFDHEGDTREAALVLVLPKPEKGIACSMFREGALFGGVLR